MNITLTYEDKQTFPINKITVIGNFNDYEEDKGMMQKEGDFYTYSIDLPEGEYHYRFLINGELYLTDPYNNVFDYLEEDDELWSFLKIDSLGRRLYNEENYTLRLEDYDLMTTISELPNQTPNKLFQDIKDKQIVVRVQFTQITGIHNITAAFYSPNGKLYEYSENILFQPEEQENVFLWFWVDMQEIKANVSYEGTWFIRLFINGEHILEDTFSIKKEIEITPIQSFI